MKFISLFIILICVSSSFSQSSYINHSSKWHERSGGTNGITNHKRHSILYIDGDTIVNGKNYFNLFQYTRDSVWNLWTQEFYGVDTMIIFRGMIRDENDRVYFQHPQGNIESVRYDFNLSVGDTISNAGCGGQIVEQIDTFSFGLMLRKRFILESGFPIYEGIGYNTGFLGSPCFFIEQGNSLICYQKDSIIFSVNPSYDCLLEDSINYCVCTYSTSFFCGMVNEDSYLILGKILESVEGGQLIEIIDNVLGIIEVDTIFINKDFGINCSEFIGSIGDTILFNLSEIAEGIFEDEGCGNYQLQYSNDSLYGVINSEILAQSYGDFINEFENCIETPLYIQAEGRVTFWYNNHLISNLELNINQHGYHSQTDDEGVFQTTFGLYNEVNRTVGPISLFSDKEFTRGVTTQDIIKIKEHILGNEIFENPYRIIAADVDGSQSITTLDIIHIRRLILGLSNNFPIGKSWEFIDAAYWFPDSRNPWLEVYPTWKINDVSYDLFAWRKFDYIGIKLGDVTGDI